MPGPGIQVEQAHPTRRLDPALCMRVLSHVAQREGVAISELTLVLCDHQQVRELNQTYLQHDYDTDVLAFDLRDSESTARGASESDVAAGNSADNDDAAPIEGEIYVDLDTAVERCEEFQASFEQEALRYAVHGLLHLIGYSDKTSAGKLHMHELEDLYLGELALLE